MVLVVIIIVFGAFYFGEGHNNNQSQNNQANQNQIDQLKQEVENLKNQKPTVVEKTVVQQSSNQNTSNNTSNITAQDISKYLTGVGEIECWKTSEDGRNGQIGPYPAGSMYSSASGSLWNIKGKYYVLTNNHAISTDHCDLFLVENGGYPLTYSHDTPNSFSTTYTRVPTGIVDKALLEIKSGWVPSGTSNSPISSLNYNISSLPHCDNSMPIGSPMVIIGYPSSSAGGNSYLSRIVTNGVISGLDNSTFSNGLSAPNYFVSAKLDAGNSGGIALSKNSNGLCVLGIPTWVSLGEYETEGMVQNIHNIFPN